jgi:DNA replication protein DnaC
VNTPIADDTGSINLEGFFEALRKGSNILLSGPPGSGKTHLARHAAIKLVGERLPIFLRARDFDGDALAT